MLDRIENAIARLKDVDGDRNPAGTFALPLTLQELQDLYAVLAAPDSVEAKAARARLEGGKL